MLWEEQMGARSSPHLETAGRVRPKVVGFVVVLAFPGRHVNRIAPLT